jgi:hypothetical protein
VRREDLHSTDIIEAGDAIQKQNHCVLHDGCIFD